MDARRPLTCDSSCPDCLRSWDNRHLHPLLDWRLALDPIVLAVGRPVTLKRWFDRSGALTAGLARAYSEALEGLAVESVHSLDAITCGRGLLPSDTHCGATMRPVNEDMAGRKRVAAEGFRVYMSDVRQLQRRPEGIYRLLVSDM